MSLSDLSSSTYWGSRRGKNPFMYFCKYHHCPWASLTWNQTCNYLYLLKSCLFLQAPCRKLLTSLIKGLDAHLFKSDRDIYMPNCDKRGFFRKKQVNFQIRFKKLTEIILARIILHRLDALAAPYQGFSLSLFVLFVQCWSSRGKQRGKCWCVDENGMPVSSNTKKKGGLSC